MCFTHPRAGTSATEIEYDTRSLLTAPFTGHGQGFKQPSRRVPFHGSAAAVHHLSHQQKTVAIPIDGDVCNTEVSADPTVSVPFVLDLLVAQAHVSATGSGTGILEVVPTTDGLLESSARPPRMQNLCRVASYSTSVPVSSRTASLLPTTSAKLQRAGHVRCGGCKLVA